MKHYYIRFGRRFAVPSTVQIKHEISRIVLADQTAPAMAQPASCDINLIASIK